MDIHQVRQRVAIGLPHVLGEVNAAHDFTSAAHQGFENRVLLRGKAEGDAPARDLVAERVEREVLDGEEDRSGQLGSAQERVESGEQLGKHEWLREVVIGSRIQAQHAFFDRIPRG